MSALLDGTITALHKPAQVREGEREKGREAKEGVGEKRGEARTHRRIKKMTVFPMIIYREDVLLVKFMYLVFTRMPGVSYRRRLGLCSSAD